MKRAFTVPEAARHLNLSRLQLEALIALVFDEQRHVLSLPEVQLLREAAHLERRQVSKRALQRSVARLRQGLEASVRGGALTTEGQQLVMGRGAKRWNAASGQALLDFGTPSTAPWRPRPVERNAEALFAHAVSLEDSRPLEALELYLEAVAANPYHADAHINAGRLLHHHHRLAEAEAHYVAAVVARPADAVPLFNLAVVLEDQGRLEDAIARYQEALEADPRCVDACFNLARLYERKGEKMAAIRQLNTYRRLTTR